MSTNAQFLPSFKKDLSKEETLGNYLDTIYRKLHLSFKRCYDLPMQLQGIDLVYRQNSKIIHIDEKAQLHYLNKDLPTFTFELSYLKHNQTRQGWLFDFEKTTNYYFLITAIYLHKKDVLIKTDDIKNCKITSVDRNALIEHLHTLGLTKAKLEYYDCELRKKEQYGQHLIEELPPKYGSLHFTEHLIEKPINLKLNLQYLINAKVAKRIY